jgi:hypothetical protein
MGGGGAGVLRVQSFMGGIVGDQGGHLNAYEKIILKRI